MFIMKKQITFLVAFMVTAFMVAQVPTVDFEGTEPTSMAV